MNRALMLAVAGSFLVAGAKIATTSLPWITTMAAARTLRIPRVAVERHPGSNPVVVELFTSEGCSSCPPADRLLSGLRGKSSGVIILEEHVDYWNHIGWKDPFSSASFSERQSQYANRLKLDGVYTPQMIVDGQTEFVGSDAGRAENAIKGASRQAKAKVSLDITHDSADVLVDQAPGDSDVVLALTEDGLQSHVSAGENSGATLVHNGVVREMRMIGRIAHKSGEAFQARVPLRLPSLWRREKMMAVVFVQSRPSGKIVGAAAVPL